MSEVNTQVSVKTLNWRPESDGRYSGGIRPGFFRADDYRLLPDTEGRYRIEDSHFTFLRQRFPSVEDAKAAAQADYETRIRSALVLPAVNSHEQMLKALKEARAMLRVVSLDDADEDYRASWNKGVAEIDAAIAAAGDA